MVYSKEYKQRIAFEYPCYICGDVLAKARQTINHIENTHGYRLPARLVGHKRPENPNFTYVNNPQAKEDFEVYHYSCPSCFFHCVADDEKGLAPLADHINEAHELKNVNPSKNDNGKEKGGQVTQVTRHKLLPETEFQPQEENEDEDQLEEEEEEEYDEKQLNQDIYQIYLKVNDLVNMFTYLFRNNTFDADNYKDDDDEMKPN